MEQFPNSDMQLLARYVSEGAETAFARLVERHARLVFTVCYRELRQKELAEEATQMVFLTLAKKAKTIYSSAALVSWLYTTARFKARLVGRQEQRQMARDRLAAQEVLRRYERSDDELWAGVEPALNDAIAALSTPDQQAILLRFFEERNMREVGQAMGTNEDAARKRVSRAVEKLRTALVSRKAATISAAALAALLTERATYALPAHLPVAIAQSAGALPSSASPASQLFRPLNPIIGKGLLIVSTTKIVAGGVAAVVVILGLTIFAVHRLHSAIPSAMPPVVWQAPQASDTATRQAEQQVQTMLAQQIEYQDAGNVPAILGTLSTDFVATDWDGKRVNRDQWAPEMVNSDQFHRHPHMQKIVTSFTLTGNTATVHFYSRQTDDRHPKPQNFPGDRIITLANVGGTWLETSWHVH